MNHTAPFANFNVQLHRDPDGYYCSVGWMMTKKFPTAKEAAMAGNLLGFDLYGSTAIPINLERFM
jgi:hypothetical protein